LRRACKYRQHRGRAWRQLRIWSRRRWPTLTWCWASVTGRGSRRYVRWI